MLRLTPAEETARDREYQRQYYLANRERVLARCKERRSDPEFKARESERGRQYYEANREQTLARQKRRHARPDIKAMRAESAKRRAQDPKTRDALNAAGCRYRANHPDRHRQATSCWHLAHPECHAQGGRASKAKETARRYGAPFEDVRYAAIVERDKGICQICGQPVDFQAPPRSPFSPSWDHIVPFSQGGAHTESNVQLAHLTCNIRKGARERYGAAAAGEQRNA